MKAAKKAILLSGFFLLLFPSPMSKSACTGAFRVFLFYLRLFFLVLRTRFCRFVRIWLRWEWEWERETVRRNSSERESIQFVSIRYFLLPLVGIEEWRDIKRQKRERKDKSLTDRQCRCSPQPRDWVTHKGALCLFNPPARLSQWPLTRCHLVRTASNGLYWII